jgi:predicted phosphodiesterase
MLNRRQFIAGVGSLGVPVAGQNTGANDFHFALIGDRTGNAAPQIYTRVLREVHLFHPDFAVNVGDTIEGLNDTTAAKEWDAMDALYKRYLRFPMYSVAGNHDIWSPASEKLYRERTGRPPFYSLVHQNALFLVLDNSRTEDLSPTQLEFAEAELMKHRARKPKFVLFHKPFWLVPIRLGNGGFPLHQLAMRHGVDSVISGHGHQLVHLERDGVHYLEVGSSGGSIARGLQIGQGFREGWFYHWIWVRVRGTTVAMTVKEIGPAWGQSRVFKLEDWDATGPKFDPSDPALADSPRL